jgi:hypothetical protein
LGSDGSDGIFGKDGFGRDGIFGSDGIFGRDGLGRDGIFGRDGFGSDGIFGRDGIFGLATIFDNDGLRASSNYSINFFPNELLKMLNYQCTGVQVSRYSQRDPHDILAHH